MSIKTDREKINVFTDIYSHYVVLRNLFLMSQTIPIHFKATGESFDVPYQIQMTIRELIEYVCKQSGVLSNTDPDNYYMGINNNDVLDDHRTIEEIGLNQPNRFYSLTVCIKTRILIERILKSHNEFWQIPSASISQKIQSGNIEMR